MVAVGHRAGGVVPVCQDGAALGGGENVECADGAAGIVDGGGQQPGEALADRLDAGRIEQVGAVVEPQPQSFARRRQEAQRIVRGVMPGDAGKPQAAGLGRKSRLVDRIVLEHRQRVEQFAQPGQSLDLGQS